MQLYAFSKWGLASGHATDALMFENLTIPELGIPAFTIRPSQASPFSWDRSAGGIEWLVGGTVGDGYETDLTADDHMVVWALQGTSTLATPWEHVTLSHKVLHTLDYAHPEHAIHSPLPGLVPAKWLGLRFDQQQAGATGAIRPLPNGFKARAVRTDQEVGREIDPSQSQALARKGRQVKQIKLGLFAPTGQQHGSQ